jgi:sulfur-oxidizing protein SoxZ
MAVARIQIPAQVRHGEVIAIRINIRHPMETGFRRDDEGHVIPKNTISQFVCRYNGEEIFRAELGSGISANPYLQFFTVAQTSGELEFSWMDDAGENASERAPIAVTE